MELMIVLAFLFVLLCSVIKNGTMRTASKLTRFVYEDWGKEFVDKDLEDAIVQELSTYPAPKEAGVFRKEFDEACVLHPECIKPKFGLYNRDEWEIPVVLALHGKLPSYQIQSGSFYNKGAEHLKMYRWIESELRARGIDVTLCWLNYNNDPPLPVTDETTGGRYLLGWRGRDKRGNFIATW